MERPNEPFSKSCSKEEQKMGALSGGNTFCGHKRKCGDSGTCVYANTNIDIMMNNLGHHNS